MSMQTTTASAVKKLSLGLLATIEACGNAGANDELISIAMAPYGATDRHRQFFVETMLRGGLIASDEQACFHLTAMGRVVKTRLAAELSRTTRVMH